MSEKLSNISAHIPQDMADKLQKIANFEERPKSYYIKKGLAEILEEKARDMEDYIKAKKTLKEAKKNSDFVSFEEVFKNIK